MFVRFIFPGEQANECPKGHYCEAGTANPTPCPKGTLSDEYRLQQEADCELCPAGEYCSEVGQNVTSGPCEQG